MNRRIKKGWLWLLLLAVLLLTLPVYADITVMIPSLEIPPEEVEVELPPLPLQ